MKQLRVVPMLLAFTLGLAMLVSLGVWQLQRLAWKQQLIADYDRAIASEPVSLDQALNLFLDGKRIDGMKVKAVGKYGPREPLRLLSSTSNGPAWELVHGFGQTNGSPVLVNRGKIAHGQALPAAPADEVEIIGHLIWHDKGRGYFDVDNNPDANTWFWWDVVAMTNQFSATHVDPNYIVLNLIAGAPGTEGLQIDPPKTELRNNHLGYAITWFGLAAVLLVMTTIFVIKTRKQS